MSAISGFGSAVQGLYKSFQNLQAAQSSGSSSTSTANAVGTIATDVSNTLAKFAGHHGHHGGGGGGGGGLRTRIEAAVQGALANVSPGTSSSDVDETIQNAISSVLKNNQNATNPTTTSTPVSDNEDDAATDSTQESDFTSFLQQHGVSLSEFQSDLQTAFKNAWASGQTPDTSSIFSQLPTGSELDVTA